eukprot:1145879-Pelagomonas_calceolata.AAC.3
MHIPCACPPPVFRNSQDASRNMIGSGCSTVHCSISDWTPECAQSKATLAKNASSPGCKLGVVSVNWIDAMKQISGLS